MVWLSWLRGESKWYDYRDCVAKCNGMIGFGVEFVTVIVLSFLAKLYTFNHNTAVMRGKVSFIAQRSKLRLSGFLLLFVLVGFFWVIFSISFFTYVWRGVLFACDMSQMNGVHKVVDYGLALQFQCCCCIPPTVIHQYYFYAWTCTCNMSPPQIST